MSELRICLDPGHNQKTNAGVVSGYYEGTQVYRLACFLKEELEKYEGVKVFMTKSKINTCPSLRERGQCAVDNQCEVLISLHTNAFSSPTAYGVSIFYSQHRPSSRDLADQLGKSITSLMKKDTGITYYRGSSIRKYPAPYTSWDYYGVIRDSVGSAGQNKVVKYSYIIEHGFHTNSKECAWMLNENNLKELAEVEACVIANYFDKTLRVEENPNVVVVPDSKYTEYTVKKGDTLGKIASAHNTTVSAIYEANRNLIKNIGLISVGWVLKIPVKEVVEEDKKTPVTTFKEGDEVKFKSGATTWANGVSFPSWVKTAKLYIRSAPRSNNTTIVVSTLKSGAVTGTARISDLEFYKGKTESTPLPTPVPPAPKPCPPKDSQVTTKIKVGDIVKVKPGAKTYTNKSIASWVYNKQYVVSELKKDRAVLDKNGLCTAFNVKDLIIVKKAESHEVTASTLKPGDKVMFKSTATKWASGSSIPNWVKRSTLYVRSDLRVNGTQVVVSILRVGPITGVARISDLQKK